MNCKMKNEKDLGLESIIDSETSAAPTKNDSKGFKLTKEHWKGIGILGGSLAAAFLLRDNQAELTEFFRENFPWVTDDKVSLSIDIITNSILATTGFAIANYANGTQPNKIEMAGQLGFAAAWGAVRHYYYGLLSDFDTPVTVENVAKKTGLFMPYTWFYAHLYLACSYLINSVSHGNSMLKRETYSKLVDKLKAKSGQMLRDGNIWTNIALHLANIYINPFVESRPTVGGLLLIHYNMSVIRHSHQMPYGFVEYFKQIFKGSPSGT